MPKRIFPAAILVMAGVLFAEAVFAQAAGVSLAAEIKSIEETVNNKSITPVQRRDALVRLASIRQLSGDIEGAANDWHMAAGAIPGQTDDDALLARAFCLAAMGEWERVGAALAPLLTKSSRARFLDISVKAIQSGDNSALSSLASDPAYAFMKSAIYFLLWKTSRGQMVETWRHLLVTEFPLSAESRLASKDESAVIRTNPFWLFISGFDSLSLAESGTRGGQAAPASQSQIAVPSPPAAGGVKLQTGIFSRQENAGAQVESLKKAGFSPLIERRGEMWAVIVSVESDTNRAIAALKNAGFESFPVR